MKFLTTMKFDRANVDSKEMASMVDAAKSFFKKSAEAGHLECAYATLEHPAKVIAIVSADSHEAMLKMIGANPLAPIASICVQSLADVSAAFESAETRTKK